MSLRLRFGRFAIAQRSAPGFFMLSKLIALAGESFRHGGKAGAGKREIEATGLVVAPGHDDLFRTRKQQRHPHESPSDWDEFAQEHPEIRHTLNYKPWLINDPSYLRRHPSLEAFFQNSPQIKEAMNQNPANFAAIPPRLGE